VFDGIRHVNFAAVDSSLNESSVQQPAGGSYEGLSREVFLIPGLLTDEHDLGSCAASAEDGLRSPLPQIAGLAFF
jgi:hypothetical protein